MKINLWVILCAMLSSSLLAQQATNVPAAPADPAPAAAVVATSAPPKAAKAPAASTKKKAKARKAAPKVAQLRTVPLVAGPAVVVANRVNVRGQAKLNSEVITQLTKGELVQVLGEVTLKNSGPDEPSAWAQILLPTNATVWLHGAFVDAANKTVSARKLNVRGGPGENYSILGQLRKGDVVSELQTKGEWIKIQAPSNSYAFVAAQYLSQELPAATATPAIAENTGAAAAAVTNEVTTVTNEPPTTATVADTTKVAGTTVDVALPVSTNTVTQTAETATAVLTNVPGEIAATGTNEVAETETEEPPPKRVVLREGLVRGTVSIQAPTKFALVSPETGRLIDYLFTTSRELDLQRYKGMRIIVTGEEALEERWGNTPVLTIQRIQVLE